MTSPSNCPVCGHDHSQHSRQYKWILHNPEKQKVYQKRYYTSDKAKERARKYYATPKWVKYRQEYYKRKNGSL